MYKIQFGNYNSYDDFGLYLTGLTIGEPALKTNYLNIPALDGQTDLSGVISANPIYDNRAITYTFVWRSTVETFEDEVRAIAGALHGQDMKVVHGASPFYYEGKLTVSSPTLDSLSGKATVTVSLNAFPYALKSAITSSVFVLTSTEWVATLTNGRMQVIPTFTLTGNNAEATIVFKNVTVTMSAGESRFADIIFTEGENVLTVSGSGTLTVSYREGAL